MPAQHRSPVLAGPVLLYDGDCAFCRTWVSRLERLDRAGAIRCIPAARRGQIEGLPPIGDADLDRAMHLVTADGQILVGARSVPEILRHLPHWRWLRGVFAIPGVLSAADRVYFAVAKRRHRFGCGSDRCRMGQT